MSAVRMEELYSLTFTMSDFVSGMHKTLYFRERMEVIRFSVTLKLTEDKVILELAQLGEDFCPLQ